MMPHHGMVSEVVRPPLQARSRAGWERALEVGLELLQEGGYEALTVSEVCRRAAISAPSLYARVDGRLGLFRAVYERGMAQVIVTEDRVFAEASGSLERTVDAVVEVFETHGALLRAVIRHAASDPDLLHRGAAESRRVLDRIVDALPPAPSEAATIVARLLYTESAFRAMYGERFWSDAGESREAFSSRLLFAARRILHASD